MHTDDNFKLATLNNKEYEALKKAEQSLKTESGKEIILIAYEKIN